ncbi:hypothetical protein OJ997_05495 [Solirubrobacter phytolaccae]|uniref:Uncharacterized protein n=1 Tax=Solirubrobacter phytolaccae TaxID=1404360 RepID=A0A9X3N4S7_9ACTN|nr:hypothetical protein [Solirubrobacter phytolaccae]MDA0179738.1 hypothetical protein [Solirubrobacter phytolaccae]
MSEGDDRRALLHCFAGCEPRAIVAALGLSWADLFPDNHRHAGSRAKAPQPPAETGQPVVEVLAGLMAAGIPIHLTLDPRLFIADRCPGCDERRPGALWISHDPAGASHCASCRRPHGRVKLTCFNGCSFETILGALELLLTARERGTPQDVAEHIAEGVA